MQDGVEIGPGGAPRGSQTDKQTRDQGDGNTKAEDAPVKTEIKADGNVSHSNVNRTDQTRGPYAYDRPKDRAHECEQETFCEQLAHNAAASRPQRGTNGEFTLTRGGP